MGRPAPLCWGPNRAKRPENVVGGLALEKEAAHLIEWIERRQEWLQSRRFCWFCSKMVRNVPPNDFQSLHEVGSKVEGGGDRALEDPLSLTAMHLWPRERVLCSTWPPALSICWTTAVVPLKGKFQQQHGGLAPPGTAKSVSLLSRFLTVWTVIDKLVTI